MTGNLIKTFFATTALGVLCAIPVQAQQFERVNRGITVSFSNCSGCDFSDKDLHGMDVRRANLSGSLFNRANLSGGKFYVADLTGAHFKKAFLARVTGDQVILKGANLTDATLTETSLSNSVFEGAVLSGADLARGTFSGANFGSAKLDRVKALGTDFTGSAFISANLDRANLTAATLDNVGFQSADFGYAILTGASLEGANLTGAKMSKVSGLKQTQLDAACGDSQTELPIGLSVSYCVETLGDAAHVNLHPALTEREDYIAARIDRAIGNVEALMIDSEPGTRRELQKIHSDLMAVRRKVED